MKRVLPILLLVMMAFATFAIRRCNNEEATISNKNRKETTKARRERAPSGRTRSNESEAKFNRNGKDLYFTKHAKCRMKCRHITQQEVKEILSEGTINYNKSNLKDPKGPTYALEGNTDDGQHVRIIFAPKQTRLTVVTVIDLENEYECNCN